MATNDDPPVPSDEATPWYEVKKVPIWLIKAIVLFWAGWIVV